VEAVAFGGEELDGAVGDSASSKGPIGVKVTGSDSKPPRLAELRLDDSGLWTTGVVAASDIPEAKRAVAAAG
jgi:hypothetical protein